MNQPAYNIVTRHPHTTVPVIRVFLVTFWHERILGSDTLLAMDSLCVALDYPDVLDHGVPLCQAGWLLGKLVEPVLGYPPFLRQKVAREKTNGAQPR